ncbi:metal ion binding [Homalodisca vitripennis]|nr:metal ion binding [Homalodisca vitripennis]
MIFDIAPKHEKGWTASAKKAFEGLAKAGLLRVYVDDVKDSHFSVTLYDIQRDKDICINGGLVEKGYANSIGPRNNVKRATQYRNKLMRRSHEHHWSPSPRGKSRKTCLQVREVREKTGLEIKEKSGNPVSISFFFDFLSSAQSKFLRRVVDGSKLDKQSATSSMKKLVTASAKHTGETESREEEEEMSALERMEELEKGADRVRVNVLKVVSPSELYITFDKVQEQILRLSDKMTEFYESTPEEPSDWEVGDLCAVLRETDNKWYRGVVTEVVDMNCKVFIKDIVEVVECTSLEMRTLDPSFNSVMDGTVKCHLSGIIPSGGSKNWTRSSIDHIKVLISEQSSTSQFYITKTGDYDDGSLPIQMWIREDKYLGALDPKMEDWKDVSKDLIEFGLALPEHRYHSFNKSEKSESTLHDVDSKSDGTSSIQKWLENSFQKSKTTNTTGIPSPPANVPSEVGVSRAVDDFAFNVVVWFG